MHQLGICFKNQVKLAEALPLCLQEFELKGSDARKDEHFFNLIEDLGVLYGREKRPVEAEGMFQEALFDNTEDIKWM